MALVATSAVWQNSTVGATGLIQKQVHDEQRTSTSRISIAQHQTVECHWAGDAVARAISAVLGHVAVSLPHAAPRAALWR